MNRFFIVLLIIISVLAIYIAVHCIINSQRQSKRSGTIAPGSENFAKHRMKIKQKKLHKYLTIGIKTFLRPHCLKECIKSIRKYYTRIPIYVADDSTDDVKLLNKKIISEFNDDAITLFDMPYDSGLSAGRNELVRHTKTPYFLVLDDARQFTNKTDIYGMLKFLSISGYDLVAGVCNERDGEDSHYSRKFISEEVNAGERPVVRYKDIDMIEPISSGGHWLKAYDTNQTLNLFIAKTSHLKQSPWNDESKMGEHELFFYQWWKNNFTCAISFDILFGEATDKTYLLNGRALRERAEDPEYVNYKYKYVEFVDDHASLDSSSSCDDAGRDSAHFNADRDNPLPDDQNNIENFKTGYLPPLKKN